MLIMNRQPNPIFPNFPNQMVEENSVKYRQARVGGDSASTFGSMQNVELTYTANSTLITSLQSMSMIIL